MSKSTKPFKKKTPQMPQATALLARLAEVNEANIKLSQQMQQLAGLQSGLATQAEETHTYIVDFIHRTVAALDHFDKRLRVLEEKAGVPSPVLDNDSETH